MTKNKSLVQAIENDFHQADVPAKDIAMLEYAQKLTVRGPDGAMERAGFIPGYWRAGGGPLFLYWFYVFRTS